MSLRTVLLVKAYTAEPVMRSYLCHLIANLDKFPESWAWPEVKSVLRDELAA